MPVRLLHRLFTLGRAAAQRLRQRLLAATRPTVAPLAAGCAGRLLHPRADPGTLIR